jgi:hypothetical protein
MHLLRMFFNHWIQPLQRRWTKMWTYPRPSCLDCPSSEELSAAEVKARIHKVMDLGVQLNSGVDPIPLR